MLATDERARLRRLWADGRSDRLRRELAEFTQRTPGAARDAADTAFIRGDRAAGFHEYARPPFADVVKTTIGGWYEQAATTLRGSSFAPRDRITAALLIGDAEAACGRYREARTAWSQSLDAGGLGAVPSHVYYPEWTSSLRRLIVYRRTPDRSRDDVFCQTAEAAQAANAKQVAQYARAAAQLAAAWRMLARGEAHAALRSFDAAAPFWRRNQSTGRGYADVQRGTVIAALFAREDARAQAALRSILDGTGGARRGDALVFAGRWNDAFAAYRDDTAREPMAEGIDPVVAAGADAARAGDLRKAIDAWSATPVGSGPDYLHDEQTALIGIARARLGDWNGAVDAWLDATRMGRPVPEWESLEPGNITALDMLFHFRDRYARGDRAYQLRVDPGPRA